MRTRLFTFLLALIFVAGCSKQAGNEETLYTCGMHPQVIQKGPGNCPICGMKLTPVRKTGADVHDHSGHSDHEPGAHPSPSPKYYKSTMNPGEISQKPGNDSMGMAMVPVYEEAANDSGAISIDPVTTQNMGFRTEPVIRGAVRREIRTVGMIDYNETALMDVTTKYKGWVENLYADATGQQVKKGDPLFDIYSPELWSAQSEYLLSLKQPNRSGPNPSRTRLKFYDVSDAQIAEIEKSKEPLKAVRINAPMDGIIIEKMVVAGQMVDAGMKLYRIADLSLVWVQAQVYEQDIPFLRLGQEASVTLTYLSESKFRGRVTYIYPTVDDKTRTAKVRLEFHNPGLLLKPGMFANVLLRAELSPSALLVPSAAILRSGERNTVFVALGDGKFEPRTVVLGPRAENNNYQVLSGIKEGEQVVTSGQFMLDSESQLREAIRKMQNPNALSAHSSQEGAEAIPAEQPAPTPAPSSGNGTAYVCPMPEHESILHKAPGKCPLCGMTLIPVPDIPPASATPTPSAIPDSMSLPMASPSPHVHLVNATNSEGSPTPGSAIPSIGIAGFGVPPKRTFPQEHSLGDHADVERDPNVRPGPAVAGGPATGTGANSAPLKLYTCPMESDAHVVSDKPGECPECGMALVETTKVKHGKIAEAEWARLHPEQAPGK